MREQNFLGEFFFEETAWEPDSEWQLAQRFFLFDGKPGCSSDTVVAQIMFTF